MITHYQFLNAWVKAHIKSERGASLVEYALLVALIALVAVGAITTTGTGVNTIFGDISAELTDAGAP